MEIDVGKKGKVWDESGTIEQIISSSALSSTFHIKWWQVPKVTPMQGMHVFVCFSS